ncbi:hypothetical protein PUV47_13250 [Pseudovibrio exalbescens]|uniref:polysaccharide pyruvyl transferase family protein n=1 Tax=Pseudovibrio exalbescens TaxID=197461 RepID=UPI0023665A8B|nr:polysaccharide pyruvyl transferase family protein [Pseudovibrio exalbescens]MDD7910888.1 hypothetical protein [Pseudovibrio exalbescens]
MSIKKKLDAARIKLGLRKDKERDWEYTNPPLVKYSGTGKPKLRILGSHDGYHCGCTAVIESLRKAAIQNGWQVAVYGEPFHALAVNGEGAMHDNGPNFHKKMRALKAAVEFGAPAFLVNTVWANNTSNYDGILRKLDRIITRDVLSQHELRASHDVLADFVIDASFFFGDTVHPKRNQNRHGVAVTDYYSKEMGKFVKFVNSFENYEYLDLAAGTWQETIDFLSSKRVLITGRHHAVYAACKARTPFVALEGNTHKIRGLIESSGLEIPVASSLSEAEELFPVIDKYERAFSDLFDWMAEQDGRRVIPSVRSAADRWT